MKQCRHINPENVRQTRGAYIAVCEACAVVVRFALCTQMNHGPEGQWKPAMALLEDVAKEEE